jgi:ribose/xylose/arabinose/galactoside ABC-type transport system permease subunit
MKNMLRGIALSIGLYVVVTGMLILTVKLCGGEFYQIPGILFLGIGVCTGIFAGVINEKLD